MRCIGIKFSKKNYDQYIYFPEKFLSTGEKSH